MNKRHAHLLRKKYNLRKPLTNRERCELDTFTTTWDGTTYAST